MHEMLAPGIGALMALLLCVANASAKTNDKVILTMQGHILLEQPVMPHYPYEARTKRWRGSGVILLRVRPDGTVSKTEVFKTTGYSILDAEAMRAFGTWRFRPERAPFTVNVPCDFEWGKERTYQEQRLLSNEEAAKVKKRYEDRAPKD